MSMNAAPAGVDARVWRTRQLLAQALIDLGAARGLDAIDVGDLVDTAGVARSTFYAHYASKDDFLVSSFVNMISATEAKVAALAPDRPDLLPSRALLHHIHESKAFAVQVTQSGAYRAMMAAGEVRLREIVETNLARLEPRMDSARRRETAVYVAAGFMGLVRWWMETGLRRTPHEMQAAFERLAGAARSVNASGMRAGEK